MILAEPFAARLSVSFAISCQPGRSHGQRPALDLPPARQSSCPRGPAPPPVATCVTHVCERRRAASAQGRAPRRARAWGHLSLAAMSSVSGPSCSRKLSRESLSMTVFPTATTFALRTASFAEGSRQDSPACARAGCVAGETTRAAARDGPPARGPEAQGGGGRGVRRRAACGGSRRRTSPKTPPGFLATHEVGPTCRSPCRAGGKLPRPL